MKKLLFLIAILAGITAEAQEHFAGISTSKRVGIINLEVNPSELANLKNHFEIQLLSSSMNIANNKVGFNDLLDDTNAEDLIFAGDKPINFTFHNQIIGPGVAVRLLKWRFAITSKANIKAGAINVDPILASYLTGSDVHQIPVGDFRDREFLSNQRFNGTVWGEVGFAVARKIWENEKSLLNAGLNLKILFPGSYANMGIGNFQGTISNDASNGDLLLTDAVADVNFAYSGSLSQSFSETKQYTRSIYGNMDGLAADIGVDYQIKKGNSYKVKVGASIMNLGGMTFNDRANSSTNYKLSITGNQRLVLNYFDGVEDIVNIKQHLIDLAALPAGDLDKIDFTEITSNKDFKVNLPTTFNLYADVNLISKLNVTFFTQQRLNSNSSNNQITAQTIYSVTPRFGIGFFEAYVPISYNDFSGNNAGLGFRLGGFFMGSNSILSSISADSKQIDLNFGFRFAIL